MVRSYQSPYRTPSRVLSPPTLHTPRHTVKKNMQTHRCEFHMPAEVTRLARVNVGPKACASAGKAGGDGCDMQWMGGRWSRYSSIAANATHEPIAPYPTHRPIAPYSTHRPIAPYPTPSHTPSQKKNLRRSERLRKEGAICCARPLVRRYPLSAHLVQHNACLCISVYQRQIPD